MSDISYRKWTLLSDEAIEKSLGQFVKTVRLQQNRTQKEVARDANMSRSTLSLLERGETVTLATFIQVLRVLGQLDKLEAFQIAHTVSPMALAKMERDRRLRARKSPGVVNKRKSDW